MATVVRSTRERIVTAAERCFATRGIDGVSLREITRASGARNTMAIQYHFRDREGLLHAIVDKHAAGIDADRHARLDAYDAVGIPDLHHLAGVLVHPYAALLARPDGGPEFLRILAELVNRPRPRFGDAELADPAASLTRWRMTVSPLLDPATMPLHPRFTAIRVATTELGRRAASGPHTDDRLFASYLVDVVAAVLVAEVSTETVALLRDRAASAS